MFPAAAAGERLVAVTPGNQLLLFGTATPGITASHPITGLVGFGERVVGVDSRPTTGQVFILSVDGAANSRTYTVNPDTGAATLIGAFTVPALSPAVLYGYDFNPAFDRIRVVNSGTQNLRINPNNGASLGSDSNLSFTPPTTGPVVGLAHNQNFIGGGLPTLFAIDAGSSRLARIGGIDGVPSPNLGSVENIGPLGVNVDPATDAGFDISAAGVAYAGLTSGGVTRLYTVALPNGTASAVGPVGAGNQQLISLTSAAGDPPVAAPAPKCQGKVATVVGTNGADNLAGTKKADVIVALGGNDRVSARKGNDRVCGGNGRDLLRGGKGRDRLLGEKGKDTLNGGPGGRDLCKGGGGQDIARLSCEQDPGVP
jgi:Ca2+-binding RTX toxin-like protein